MAVGGDGTILRTLARLLGTAVPVIGVNFGRVGFLASIAPERLEADLARIFAGEYGLVEQPTLEAQLDDEDVWPSTTSSPRARRSGGWSS